MLNNPRELIEGKSVAIVGRAEYLNDLEQGELIDSHEVVIRVQSNLPYPSPKFEIEFDTDKSFVPTDFHSRLGKRTTIFAPANMPNWSMDYCDRIIPELIKRDCQYLFQHKIYNMVEPRQIAIIDYIRDKFDMPIFIADYHQFVSIVRRMDYSFPMPGTILIDWITKLQPNIMYCTGFACYQDTNDEWLKAEVKLTRDHKTLYDLRFLRDLVNQNDNITVDEELIKYFKHI